MSLLSTLGVTLPAEYEDILQKKRAVNELTLDDLMTIAQEYGEVEIGGFMSKDQVEIKCNFTQSDMVWLKEYRFSDMKRNFVEVIGRANQLREFYRNGQT